MTGFLRRGSTPVGLAVLAFAVAGGGRLGKVLGHYGWAEDHHDASA